MRPSRRRQEKLHSVTGTRRTASRITGMPVHPPCSRLAARATRIPAHNPSGNRRHHIGSPPYLTALQFLPHSEFRHQRRNLAKFLRRRVSHIRYIINIHVSAVFKQCFNRRAGYFSTVDSAFLRQSPMTAKHPSNGVGKEHNGRLAPGWADFPPAPGVVVFNARHSARYI